MLSFAYKVLIFPMMLLIAVVLSFISFQILHLWIRFDLIMIAIAILYYGAPVNYLMIFFLGVVNDVMNAMPLGTTSLLWILFAAFWVRMRMQNFCVVAGHLKSISYFAFALTTYDFLQLLMISAVHRKIVQSGFSASIVVTIAAYCVVHFLTYRKLDKL